MTWTPDRPTKPGRYEVSRHPRLRGTNELHIIERSVALIPRWLIDGGDAVEPRALAIRMDSGSEGAWIRVSDAIFDGALWRPYVEPPDPHVRYQQDAFWQLDEARAQVWGLICVATNCAIKADKGFPALRQVLDQRDELTATRDLLTAENARLQKERDAAAASLNALAKGARHVPCFGECASERICIACYGLQNLKGWVEWQKRTETERDEARSELAEARAHIATLELLRRGGK